MTHRFNLIIPVLLMTLLGMFAVFLEAGSSDKLQMVTVVLLGFLFFHTVVSELLPKSSATPYLNFYLLYALIMCGVNLGGVAVVHYVHSLEEANNAVTRWIERCVLRPIFNVEKAPPIRKISEAVTRVRCLFGHFLYPSLYFVLVYIYEYY